ncbi:MAG: putative Ig domain-containing protein, partial [Candidatus Krumholzibacteriales bacterium]
MRKVLVVLMALTLSGMFISCSEDEETVTPTPSVEELSITTSSLASGSTCSPYSVQLEAEGGTAPYTWELASGSTLPAGYELTTDGVIKGMTSDIAENSFTVTCSDNEGESVTADYSLTVDVPANPSIGIFYDETATVCSEQATAFLTTLDCYVYIMLEDSQYDCTTAAQFKVSLVDSDGNPLDSSKYAIAYTDWPDYTLTIGSLFDG